MIARVLSGGPLFVPRKARDELHALAHWLHPRGLVNLVWEQRRLMSAHGVRKTRLDWPKSVRTPQGYVLRRAVPTLLLVKTQVVI